MEKHKKKLTDYTKSNHTKTKFLEELNKASHKELMQLYEAYKLKQLQYRHIISKEKNLYSVTPGQKQENMKNPHLLIFFS